MHHFSHKVFQAGEKSHSLVSLPFSECFTLTSGDLPPLSACSNLGDPPKLLLDAFYMFPIF